MKHKAGLVILVAVSIGLGIFAQQSFKKSIQTAIVYPTPKQLHGFSLTDHNNQPFNEHSLKGSWHLVVFGFTYCPDVCPTQMYFINRLLSHSELSAKNIKGVLVSVDPMRDTSETLKNYVSFYNENILGVTGEYSELNKIAVQLQSVFSIPDTTQENYTVDHSAQLSVINPQGHLAAVFRPGGQGNYDLDFDLVFNDLILITK
jgi:protein SCO1/2